MLKSIRVVGVIAAVIAAVAVLSVGCGDGVVNSGGKSEYLDRFLDVFSKNPGHNDDGGAPNTNATYTLTVNVSPAEGTVSRNPNEDSYKAGTRVTVTVTPKEGYEFLGWSGALNSSDAQVTITMNNDKTLSAGFQRKDSDLPTYEVYFNMNGAVGAPPSSARAVSGSSITLPNEASMEKPGYSLAGWTEDKSGTGARYDANSSYTVTHGVTLYAKWVPICTVIFNGNGMASGTVPGSVTADSGNAITLPGQGNLAKGGYNFGGWSTSSSGAGDAYREGDSYTVTRSVTLYARWNEINIPEYGVTYSGNGNTSGSISGSTVQYKEGTDINLRDKGDLVKDGYAFDGWSTDPSGTGTVYPAGSSYTVTNGVTFYAKWVALPRYTVTFSGNGTTSGSPPASVETYSGNTITLPGQGTMVKSGYRFDWWNTNSAGTGTNYGAGASYTVSGNVTLYAKWTASVPDAPTNVTASATSSSSITISWAVVSGVTGYRVYRSTIANGSYTLVGTTASTSYTDNNLSSSTTYYYKISAYNSSGESLQSSYSYATPGGGGFDVNNIEMVYVTGGTFTMGCTSEQGSNCNGNEKPAHEVTLSGYYIGKYEVTQGLWKAVMGSLPSSLTSSSSYGYGDNYPVYEVSWNDIVIDFLPELNRKTGKSYRLPTEAEWEYAARGRSNSNGYMYSGSNTIGDVAWYSSNSGSTTHPIGGKSANGLGIYDMSGNVWEWVNDWYGYYSSNAQTNPIGPSTTGSGRVMRGGSWNIVAGHCRVSYRYNSNPGIRDFNLGFRLAVSP